MEVNLSGELLPVDSGNSFFSFIRRYCNQKEPNTALHRLCTLMRKMGVRQVFVEDVAATEDDVRNEHDALDRYFETETNFSAFRFTFMSAAVPAAEDIREVPSSCFLASAILINLEDPRRNQWKSYLFKAVVAEPHIVNHPRFRDITKGAGDHCAQLPLQNYYLNIHKTFKCELNYEENSSHTFEIKGTYFCQQNALTSVCAHAALSMTLNNISLPYAPGRMVATEDINRIIQVDHSSERFNWPDDGEIKRGLNREEITSVLNHFGYRFDFIDFFLRPNIEYDQYIYRYIESRCPVLLSFKTDSPVSHVVPVLGHTLNFDMWSQEAEEAYNSANRLNDYMPTASWVDHLIIHDDNLGMYRSLPVGTLKRITLPKHDPSFRAEFAVAPVPACLSLNLMKAEWASVIRVKDWLASMEKMDVWSKHLNERTMVCRTFLLTKDAYRASLNQKDFDGNGFSEEDKKSLLVDLPDPFVLSEVTIPELYTGNKNKIIDVFFACDTEDLPEVPCNNWLQVRAPYLLAKQQLNAGRNSEYAITPMSVKSHLPIVRYKGLDHRLEW